MKDIFLVINPVAGGGRRVEKLWEEQIKPLMDSYEVEYDFSFTTAPQQAIELARTQLKEGYQIICAVGGDGTANEVLNGILQAEKPGVFAIIPVGTGDDLPSVFGIPQGDLEAAVQCLVMGQNKSFDVGYCETADRYFAGVASMGFDAEAADRANKGSKRFGGRLSYQLALVQTLAKFRPYELVIRIDNGDQTIEGQRMLLAIGNGKRYGGGMHICPDADGADGRFNATTVRKVSRITLLRFFPTVYEGGHLSHESVDTFEGVSIQVESPKKKCLYQADGEVLGYLPETFSTKSNYLTVRVPTPWVPYDDLWKEKKGLTDPFTGNKLVLAKLAYFNPISNYQRGLEWRPAQEQDLVLEPVEDKSLEGRILYVKEKHFSKRVIFFLLRTFFQTIGVSIAFTAPITFPWFFDIVFPDFLALIPPEITAFIEETIRAIQALFKPLELWFPWLEPLIRFMMDLGAIFNPFLVFSVLMLFFRWINVLSEEEFQDPFQAIEGIEGIPTSTGYFLQSIQKKFTLGFSQATVALLVVSSFVSFFIVIRRARGILFEVMTTKEEIKYMKNVRKVFLKYCNEGNYTDISYSKNRLSESRKTTIFANLVKYGPMVSLVIPAILAIMYLLL